jgi:hypothetical protein
VKNDKFEELIKQSLEQIEPEVPAHLWDNIASRIAVNPPPQQAPTTDGGVSAGAGLSGASGLLKVAAAALLITGGVYLAYEIFTDKSETIEVVATENAANQVKSKTPAAPVAGDEAKVELNTESEDAVLFEGEVTSTENAEVVDGSTPSMSDYTIESESAASQTEEARTSTANNSNEVANSSVTQFKVASKPGKANATTNFQSQIDQEVVIVEAGILANKVSGDVPLTVSFQNMSAAKSYEWDFGDGIKSFDPSPTHTFNFDSDFIVKLTITDFSGNVLRDQIEINAYLPSTLFVPNAFSPNGDGDNDFFFLEGTNVTNVNFKVLRLDGTIVFEGKTLNDKWDGTDTQNPFANKYVYQARAIGSDGKPMQRNGFLHVFRDAQ